MDTSGLPQAAKEATINSYLVAGYSSMDLDYNAVLQTLVDIYKVCKSASGIAKPSNNQIMNI